MALFEIKIRPDQPDGLTTDRLDGMPFPTMAPHNPAQRDLLLDAAETVAAREGVSRLTFDAVAAEAGVSKGGLLHYFSSKEQLIEAMVQRSADGWRNCFMAGYEQAPEGPGRMLRGILNHCCMDARNWTDGLRRSYSAIFAALAQNSELVQPMRAVYEELYGLIRNDGLPDDVAEVVMAAIDGLWFYWVMRLRPVDQEALDRLRCALERIVALAVEKPETFSCRPIPSATTDA
ncbi:MAG: TetR/AcrR family transcriptional regulator [Verrucomicrobiaceae bacterium]|nr:MAG: TetR/AcrR family transcriptional regulator [Verrucomicrobiaceae bacterium]